MLKTIHARVDRHVTFEYPYNERFIKMFLIENCR